MQEKKKNNSGVQIMLMIIFGALDILCVLVLVFAMMHSNVSGKSVSKNLSGDFEANDDTYFDEENEQEYISSAAVAYNSGQGVVTVSQADTEETADEEDMYSGFVFPDSDQEYLTDAQIKETVKNKTLCRRAINEIYARHGYAFSKQENIDFFNSYDWYKNMAKESDMTAVSRQFSAAEKANVEKLQAFEDSKGWS